MAELLVLATLAFAAVVVVAAVTSVFGFVLWLVLLPFRFIGWLFQVLAVVLALPFLAVFGLIAFGVLGAGMLMFLLPFAPLALLAWAAWWLVRRNRRSAVAATH